MNSPETPEQLAQAIEELVAAYVEQGREAAVRAMNRAFSGPRKSSAPARARSKRSVGEVRARRHRSAAELAKLTEQLDELVQAHPGESGPRFAELMAIRIRALEYPMARLKAEGRVRSVGRGQMTRYYPVIGTRSRGA